MKTMTMPRQHDWVFPALALMVLLAGGILFKYDQRLPEVVWEGRDLISGLVPKELSKISFQTSSKSFSLVKGNDGFVLESQSAAPVDTQKLNEVILRLGGAQISQVIGAKNDWEKLNVSEKNAELTIELFTQSDKPKWKIFLGKSLPGKPGRAVRLEGQEDVFATSEYFFIPTSDEEFLAKEALNLSREKITSVDLSGEGQKISETKFVKDELLASLNPLKVKAHFRTGALPSELQDLSWAWTAQLLTDSGQLYKISWAKKGERWFAKASSDLNQSIGEEGAVIDIKLLTLKAQVDKFNQQKLPWIWELSSESVDKLTRGLMYGEKKKDDKVSKK